VDVHVEFTPGRAVLDENLKEVGRTTQVQAFIMAQPANLIDELPLLKTAVSNAIDSGEMGNAIRNALEGATGLIPDLEKMKMEPDRMTQWSLAACESHMTKLVRRFSLAYTRRMVPTAIYNECSNFLIKASFSHDRVLTKLDKNRCRWATVKFSKAWNFGGHGITQYRTPSYYGIKGKTVTAAASDSPEPDFKAFCHDICQIKFGKVAPRCHVTYGDSLGSLPTI